jgi:hypothetical protein
MQTDGPHIHAYTAESRPVQSTLSNSPLDAAISEILEISPAFGRSMINGQLKASRHEVTRECIVAPYLSVHGAPGFFGDPSIHQKAYKVAGANSLCHHDRQHGDVPFNLSHAACSLT